MSSRTDMLPILADAFSSFGAAADAIGTDRWAAQSLCPAWTVRDVVLHSTTIESALVGWRPGDDNPFLAMPAIATTLGELDADTLLARWGEVTAARLDELAGMDDDTYEAPSVTPVGPGTYARFMRIRVFDVWVHERDFRVPLGIPGDDAGPAAEVALDEVEASLGYIVGKKVGLPDGASIEFDLTGPVRRTMCVAVDGKAGRVDHLDDPTVTLTTDSLTFMLLACGRIDPEGPIGDGRVVLAGDASLADHAARSLAFTM